MASLTLGQHPSRHHIDSDQHLFHKLKVTDRKKFSRKWSLEKIMRHRPINQDPPASQNRTGTLTCSPCPPMDPLDKENTNNNHGRTMAGIRRSSIMKDTTEIQGFSSSMPEELEGLQLDRLTQARSGVVKMRCEPLRREAWSIFNQKDPRVKMERGEGHVFTSRQVSQDWCDACNRNISRCALKCHNCSYTCHLECQGLVQLDCNQLNHQTENVSAITSQGHIEPDDQEANVPREVKVETITSLTEDEIKAKIIDYNTKVTENGMKLDSDGTYTGFIKVHLKLRRPVTVFSVDGKSPGPCSSSDSSDNRTSFYLPKETVKQLHISSTTTVHEVIQGLLKKFMVQDNPRKFALYRQTHRDNMDVYEKLPLSDCPLYLRLLAGPDLETVTFVLKENETGEVEWDAFSVPELQNFLIILEKEENERLRQLELRYTAYREKLQQALCVVQGKPD